MYWKRNTNGYLEKVKQLLDIKIFIPESKSQTEKKLDQDCQVLLVKFDYKEWENLKQYISNKNGHNQIRFRFRQPFHTALSYKMQELGVKCYIKNTFNWFNSTLTSWHGG